MSTTRLAVCLLVAALSVSCSQKAKVDRAFSSIQAESVGGQRDLDAALDTGEVGPTAEPFRGLSAVTLRADGAGGGQRPFFNAESPGTGESPDDAAHPGRVGSHPRWGDLPAVAYRASGGDPRVPAGDRADGDPGEGAFGSGTGGGGVRERRPGEAGDDRSAGGPTGNGCAPGDRPGVRQGVQDTQDTDQKGEDIMTTITTALVWGLLGYALGTLTGVPVLKLVLSKFKA